MYINQKYIILIKLIIIFKMSGSNKKTQTKEEKNISEQLLSLQEDMKKCNLSSSDYDSFEPKKEEKNEENLNLNQITTEQLEDFDQSQQSHKENSSSNLLKSFISNQLENNSLGREQSKNLAGKPKNKNSSRSHTTPKNQEKLKKRWSYKFYTLIVFGCHKDTLKVYSKKDFKNIKNFCTPKKTIIFKKNTFYIISRKNTIKEFILNNHIIFSAEESLFDDHHSFIYHQNSINNQNPIIEYQNYLEPQNDIEEQNHINDQNNINVQNEEIPQNYINAQEDLNVQNDIGGQIDNQNDGIDEQIALDNPIDIDGQFDIDNQNDDMDDQNYINMENFFDVPRPNEDEVIIDIDAISNIRSNNPHHFNFGQFNNLNQPSTDDTD